MTSHTCDVYATSSNKGVPQTCHTKDLGHYMGPSTIPKGVPTNV